MSFTLRGRSAAASIKVGFTGTQNGMKKRQLRTVGQILLCHLLIEYLPVEFHHGDCIGADEEAHKLARALRFRIISHPSDIDDRRAFCRVRNPREPKPFLERNQDIVDETAFLIGAPDGPEKRRSGTWSTIRYARKKGRVIYVAYPDGKMTVDSTPIRD